MKQLIRLFLLMVNMVMLSLSTYAGTGTNYYKLVYEYEDYDHFAHTCKLKTVYVHHIYTNNPPEGYTEGSVPLIKDILILPKHFTDAGGDTFLVTGISSDVLEQLLDYRVKYTEIQIPSSVKEIPAAMFVNQYQLERISFSDDGYKDNYELSEDGNVLYNRGGTLSTPHKTLIWVSQQKTTENFIIPKDADVHRLAFNDCKLIQKVSVEEGNPYIVVNHGALFTADMTRLLMLPPVADYIKLTSTLKITPSTVNVGDNLTVEVSSDQNVVSSEDYNLFSNAVSLIIPEGIKEIGKGFTNWKRITKVNLPKSLVRVADAIFYGCDNLKDINYADFPEDIGCNVVSGTGIETVTMPSAWKSIDLRGNNLKEIILKDGCVSNVSIYCPNLEKLTYPSPNTYIKEINDLYAPPYVQSDDFELREGLEKIGRGAFIKSVITMPDEGQIFSNLEFPESLIVIGAMAFKNATVPNLKTLKLPELLDEIGEYAFENFNKSLPESEPGIELIIPENVTLGDYSFREARIKTIIYYPSFLGKKSWGDIMIYPFEDCPATRLDIRGDFWGKNTAEEWNTFWDWMNNLNQIRIYATQVLDVEEVETSEKWGTCYKTATLYVRKELRNEYRTAPFWRHFKYIKELPEDAGVDDIEISVDASAIRVVDGAIVTDDSTLMIEVYTIDGICRHRGCLNAPLMLSGGIYIVRTPTESIKLKI